MGAAKNFTGTCSAAALVTAAALALGGCGDGPAGGPAGARSPASNPFGLMPGTAGGGSAGSGVTGPVIFREDFERGAPGWTFPSLCWEVGDPRGAGPGTALSGRNLMCVKLVGGYDNGWDASCTSPAFDLTTAAHPILVLSHWYEMELNWDGVLIRVIDSTGKAEAIDPMMGYWEYVVAFRDHGFSGTSGTWREERFDLSKWAGKPGLKIQFRFASDPDFVQDGYYVDDIAVYDAATPDDLYAPYRSVALKEDWEGSTSPFAPASAASAWKIDRPNTSKIDPAPNGPRAAGVGLVTAAYPNGVNQDRIATKQLVDLTNVRGAGLYFQYWYDTEPYVDGARVVVSKDGSQWFEVQKRDGFLFGVSALAGGGYSYKTKNGEGKGWRRGYVDLEPMFPAHGRKLYIGFEFGSDSQTPGVAWCVDDIRIMTK